SGISADYYGAFARILKNRLSGTNQNPEFVAMMANGTSGNINNNNYATPAVRRAPYEQIETVANAVAQVAHQVIRQIAYQDWVPLAVKQTELRLGVRKPTAEELARARTIVAQAKSAPKMTTREEIYARETL